MFRILKLELVKTKGVKKAAACLDDKEAAKGFEKQQPVQTDDGGKRFEEAVTCPNDTAVLVRSKAQQTR